MSDHTRNGTALRRSPNEPSVAALLADILAPVTGSPLPVRLQAWDGSCAGPAGAPVISINSTNVLRRLLWRPGELGAAQAYVTGELEVEGDLGDALDHVWATVRERGLGPVLPTVRLLLRTARAARQLGAIRRPPPPPLSQARIGGRLHSLRRDRQAISHHYDMSNEFYGLILDGAMVYSCAYWTSDEPTYTLADAQRDKFDLVCRKLGLQPGMRVLDVGCGWGGFAVHAARNYDVDVVGVTLSKEQKAFADKRILAEGLDGRVDIRLQDYRRISDGPFDAVVSIEMGEHVGRGNYPRYARALYDNVKPGGGVLVQQMSRQGRHPGGGPFIESFIAPDMDMRPVGETIAMLEYPGLELRDVHALREHYVRTVAAWNERLESNWAKLVDVTSVETARVWRLYLTGGGRAFRDGRMGVDQMLFVRPGSVGRSGLPAVRMKSGAADG
ncbi:class I SAM-dependent methyltransferase [Hoyosella sp. YIM 151337]|uniref:class I SAM-dependent methyltransferase n=1 Tax=Hoyosella sp. YIM 151337 TaxID=2992742 RepID=UPI0035A868B7